MNQLIHHPSFSVDGPHIAIVFHNVFPLMEALIPQRHAHIAQAPQQEPLGAADLRQGRQVEAPVRPVAGLLSSHSSFPSWLKE